jgi:hypothetical protein
MSISRITTLSLALLIGVSGRATAATIVFPDFSSTSGLTLSGNATTTTTADGAVLRLVPAAGGQAGSAFSTATINASNFSTVFEFRLTNPGGCCDAGGQFGADGLVFVVQNISSSIGGGGGGMGYAGVTPSVGVEFDTWFNTEVGDINSNHVGIDQNGSVNSLTQLPVTPNFDNGELWTAWIDYNGTALDVRVTNTGVRPVLPTITQIIDIPGIISSPTAYVGFTAGTGFAFENHDILSWQYTDAFQDGGVPVPSAVPEPGTLILLGTGALAFVRRVRRQRAQVQSPE